jgi:hypothetical protein
MGNTNAIRTAAAKKNGLAEERMKGSFAMQARISHHHTQTKSFSTQRGQPFLAGLKMLLWSLV